MGRISYNGKPLVCLPCWAPLLLNWGPRRPHQHKTSRFCFQGPRHAGFQKTWGFLISSCSCGLWGFLFTSAHIPGHPLAQKPYATEDPWNCSYRGSLDPKAHVQVLWILRWLLGSFQELGVYSWGVLIIRALLFRVYIRVLIFGKLPFVLLKPYRIASSTWGPSVGGLGLEP